MQLPDTGVVIGNMGEGVGVEVVGGLGALTTDGAVLPMLSEEHNQRLFPMGSQSFLASVGQLLA